MTNNSRALAAAPSVRVATPGQTCVPRAAPPAVGLSLVSAQPVDGRISDLTFASRAMSGTVHADVMLPASYDPSGATRYPVLYLLHGASGNHTDWVVQGNVERIVGSLPVIVVMPDAGSGGWYSDWFAGDPSTGTSDAPGWETFHLRELLPYIDRHYPTIAARRGRAIAGLSMGGFGTMSYAARRPGLFAAAGAFSGAVDTDGAYLPGASGPVLEAGIDSCIWGDPTTNDVVWRDHNPTELARNLAHTSLFLASGNGAPSRTEDYTNTEGQVIEAVIYQANLDFNGALNARGIAHTTDFYGAGIHDWPYWQDDLRAFLPRMMAAFAHPPAAPPAVPFSYESADQRFSAWGWDVQARRAVTEFVYLSDVDASGLDVAGSGTLRVDTAPLYAPGTAYSVAETITGTAATGTGAGEAEANGAVSVARTPVADAAGRLHFDVDLGPSHTMQQSVFGPAAEASFPHARVTIMPVAGAGPGNPTATPEPGSGALYASGLAALLAGLLILRRRRERHT